MIELNEKKQNKCIFSASLPLSLSPIDLMLQLTIRLNTVDPVILFTTHSIAGHSSVDLPKAVDQEIYLAMHSLMGYDLVN